ncbi:MAG TPA: YbaB/EbfC family nucleoid-associated protein [Actinophytocola sp.]|uniref:YbaB/EbfC family nucleoid-associated protein n=1 Tax=Actinophytocola sp. TaxID=1872138 RepID=UPI002DBC564E|nr:YbaB/EbfC family nucleoid-associated protein [Actinophytocola sp.]HEU5473884.1 YbaB/EbfC family nucleoid-associated protein [Actinophytocola sp.]
MSGYQDHLDAEIRRADQKIRETGARVTAHIARRGPVTGRASSRSGAVTATVQPGGRLVELDIQGSAFTMKPEELAAEIVAVARQATRNASGRLHQALSTVVSPEVTASLAALGLTPGTAADEYVDWADVIRRTR